MRDRFFRAFALPEREEGRIVLTCIMVGGEAAHSAADTGDGGVLVCGGRVHA